MKQIYLWLLLPLIALSATAQDESITYRQPEKAYRYRVYLKDKDVKNNFYSLKHPERFLSKKALERRKRYNIKVDERDLPVSQIYLDYFRNKGFRVLHTSKWNNTAVVETKDSTQAYLLSEPKFVNRVRKIWESPDSVPVTDLSKRKEWIATVADTLPDYYGHAQHQVEMLGVPRLHDAGYRGQGMTIAIIDGGFLNADCVKGLQQARIVGTHNFVRPDVSVYEEQSHGLMVLSCIGANAPHSLVGTAPEASFYLLVSEDSESEQLSEEDSWCAALEYADSVGADLVTSSLGYNIYDNEQDTYRYYQLDGRTALISQSAALAASRGMLLLNSAGNSGDETWKKISVPADADHILTVGAVTPEGTNTNFSSVGNTADGRVKPDVAAQGDDVSVYSLNGVVTTAAGTSFSTPLLCGAVACLWQQFREKSPEEIIKAVRLSGNNASHPDNIYGYGIPDMWKAGQLLQQN